METSNKWYDNLKKSPLTPPNFVFKIVWTILYLLIFLSLCMYLSSGNIDYKDVIICGSQIILNVMWVHVFFTQRELLLSVIVILLLWMFILLNVFLFFDKNYLSGLLLLPYLIWVTFAIYLNTYIFLNN